jgi:hypothetical protein
LGGESGFESVGGVPMSSASVVENDRQFAQESPGLRVGKRAMRGTNALVVAIVE